MSARAEPHPSLLKLYWTMDEPKSTKRGRAGPTMATNLFLPKKPKTQQSTKQTKQVQVQNTNNSFAQQKFSQPDCLQQETIEPWKQIGHGWGTGRVGNGAHRIAATTLTAPAIGVRYGGLAGNRRSS